MIEALLGIVILGAVVVIAYAGGADAQLELLEERADHPRRRGPPARGRYMGHERWIRLPVRHTA